MEIDRLMTVKELGELLGLDRVTIYRLRKEGRFPRPLQLGPRTIRWRQSQIQEWIANPPEIEGGT